MLNENVNFEKRFKEQCAIEPRLEQLAKDIRSVDDSDPHFCANMVWYKRFKPVVCSLVGYEAENSKLMSEEDYDVAYGMLYDMLPDCKDCCCIRRS